MTKMRPPLSFELALTRIAGVIGWDMAAAICGQGESAVRKWSDPDVEPAAGDKIGVETSRVLDLAYRQAGGDGAPMVECYVLLLEADTVAANSDCAALAKAAANAAKEGGEAISAAIIASDPNASDADFAFAEREIEESIAAKTHMLAALRRRRKR